MEILKDRIEYIIAYMLVAVTLFISGIVLYEIIHLLFMVVSTVAYTIYITIGCILYKIGYAILF